jgi:hypothetical protein
MNDDLLKNLLKAQMSATAQTEVLDEMNRIRQTKPIVFIRTLLKLARINGNHFEFFARQFELTREELALFALEYGKAAGQTVQETIKELGLEQDLSETEKPKEPAAEEIFVSALKALHSENPKWTLSSFKHFAESRIKKYLEKDPKPYTEQDVTVGANWFNSTRKLLTEEKQRTAPRARRYAQVPRKKWQEFFKTRFRTKSPEFARDFEKAARAKAQELQNTEMSKIRQSEKTLPKSQ